MSRPAEEMSCRDLVELVSDYLEGALPAPERARFESHLAGCEPCRTYIEQVRQTIAAAGRLTEESLKPHVREQLLEAFRGWKRERTL